jgi:hypothetical protein
VALPHLSQSPRQADEEIRASESNRKTIALHLTLFVDLIHRGVSMRWCSAHLPAMESNVSAGTRSSRLLLDRTNILRWRRTLGSMFVVGRHCEAPE